MGRGYKTVFIVILVLILCILGTYLCSKYVFIGKKKTTFSVVVDKIKDYNYTLDERDPKLMKEKFKELKKVLKNKSEVDYKSYSELIAQLYIIDLYDINSKVNKYDIPCLEYIEKKEVDKFKKMIKEDFYSKLEDNSDKDRKQELPSIKSINVISNEETKFKLGEEEKDGYIITLEWEYDKDLGFDKKSEVTTIIDNSRVYVVKHSPILDWFLSNFDYNITRGENNG